MLALCGRCSKFCPIQQKYLWGQNNGDGGGETTTKMKTTTTEAKLSAMMMKIEWKTNFMDDFYPVAS